MNSRTFLTAILFCRRMVLMLGVAGFSASDILLFPTNETRINNKMFGMSVREIFNGYSSSDVAGEAGGSLTKWRS